MDTRKLRQKLLDLAIHGKLVPQDPNDEPASELLSRIHAENLALDALRLALPVGPLLIGQPIGTEIDHGIVLDAFRLEARRFFGRGTPNRLDVRLARSL